MITVRYGLLSSDTNPTQYKSLIDVLDTIEKNQWTFIKETPTGTLVVVVDEETGGVRLYREG